VTPPNETRVDVELERGRELRGRVIDGSGRPVPQAEIMPRGGLVSVYTFVTTDEEGAFTLTGVADGDQTIVATLSRPRRREVRARAIVINGSAPPVDLDFNAGIAVRGKVTQQGKPVQGNISFYPTKRDPSSNMMPGSSEIGPDGSYEVRLPAAGEYGVTVNRMNSRGATLNVPRVNVAGDMVHDIELRGATVSGRVFDAATGEPVANASVMLLPGSDMPARGGRFTFDLVADGDYRIRAQAPGYAPTLRAFSVANGMPPAEIDLGLSRGVEVLFRVVDALTGELVNAMGFTVMDASKVPMFMGDATADANGMRRIMLQPGTYQLTVSAQDYAYKPVTLTVPGPPLDVKLDRAKR
jgi:hypothetical protein